MPVRFRGKDGKFVPAEERYSKAKSVEAFRRGRWVYLIEDGDVTPKTLAVVLNRKEFEAIPAAFEEIGEYTPRRGKAHKGHEAWDIAEQIDKTKGVRRKLLRVKITVDVGKGKKKQVQFYQKINKNQKSSARIYHRINEALGAEGHYTYKTYKGKLIQGRQGTKVKITKVTVEGVL